jgi:hypothetical protein
MPAAALTPRVRIIAICDGIRESRTEAGVFSLKNVRQAIVADTFPFLPSGLWLYILLSNPRGGEHPAYILVNDSSARMVYYADLSPHPRFPDGTDVLPIRVRVRCRFPRPDRYTFQLWFFQVQGSDVLKGEFPFDVLQEGV